MCFATLHSCLVGIDAGEDLCHSWLLGEYTPCVLPRSKHCRWSFPLELESNLM